MTTAPQNFLQSYSHEDRGEVEGEDTIMYEVIGNDMQIVNILLNPGKRVEVR